MPQTTTYLAGEGFALSAFSSGSLSGNGLGFYSSVGFGGPVPIGDWQGRTFVVDPSGLSAVAEVDNCRYANPTGVTIGQTGGVITLNRLPNYLATLNVRATFDTPTRVTDAAFWVFDGVNQQDLAAAAVGVRTALYEVSHLDNAQTPVGSGGPGTPIVSGAHAWRVFEPGAPSASMACTSSPGTSGARPSGANTLDTRHDWYFAMSVSPTSAGSKRWGMGFTYNYL
jgi:hypothetical protein